MTRTISIFVGLSVLVGLLFAVLANASRNQQGVKVNQKLLQQVTGGAS